MLLPAARRRLLLPAACCKYLQDLPVMKLATKSQRMRRRSVLPARRRCSLRAAPLSAHCCVAAPSPALRAATRRRKSLSARVQHFEFNISTFCASNFNNSSVQFQYFIIKC
jgi:hypothetical protein